MRDSRLDLLSTNKTPVISTPYDPIHLTHVGFDFNTGQCELRIRAGRRFADTSQTPACPRNGRRSLMRMALLGPSRRRIQTRFVLLILRQV